MKVKLKTNAFGLKGTIHDVVKNEDGFITIHIPYLDDFISLVLIPSQVELLNK